jgi:hypothetical protein
MVKTALLKTMSFERPVDLKSAIVAPGVAAAHSLRLRAILSFSHVCTCGRNLHVELSKIVAGSPSGLVVRFDEDAH